MTATSVLLDALVFGFALWLGCYLIGRDPGDPRLRLAGLGLVAYALAWGCDLVARGTGGAPGAVLARVRWPLLFLPSLLWIGALLALLPEDDARRTGLLAAWRRGFVPVGGVLLFAGALGPGPRAGGWYLLFCAGVLPALLLAAARVWGSYRQQWGTSRRVRGLLLVALLFFGLGTGLLLALPGALPRGWTFLAIGCDLIVLGIAAAGLDAFDQGEALLPDALRSLAFAAGTAALFGGQVLLALVLGLGLTGGTAALLLAVVATAIVVQVFADPLEGLADRLVFARLPRLRRARAELRATATALTRADPALDPARLDEAEFVRLTRRALGNFGDLPRLAASPLARLPLVEARLAARRGRDDALERATELKAILGESVARLKPRRGGDFGTSDEWRYYNALYFPYIVGLKPYSRRALEQGSAPSDPAARAALDWFLTAVPERTLYNWQATAAKLVAADLRDRSGGLPPPAP